MRIKGLYVAQPISIQVVLSDMDKESSRDNTGLMHRDRITVKRKLNCEWGILGNEEISLLLRSVSDVFFPVTYPDPLTGREETRNFYVGDRTAPVCVYYRGTPIWQGLSMNFIEK